MSCFLDTALDLASRGSYVFPLKPRDKWPIVAGGFKAATRDAEQIALWWKRNPDANIGIACEASGLCVMDCDHGLTCYEDFIAWRDSNGLPPTYTVRSGRRPEFGVQMYYRGPIATSRWELDGCSGDIKSIGGLVVAPPSIHPDSGEAYAELESLAIAPTPEMVKQLKKVVAERTETGGIDTDNRNQEMCSFIGSIRKHTADMGEPECLVVCLQRNERYTKGPMPEDEVQEIVRKQFRLYPNVGPDPVATIGGNKEEKKVITDWRELFHNRDAMLNAPPVTFLIKDFLQREGVTAIAAPVRERKSLIALNIVHALLTGEKLFDYFEVVQKPNRVLYLCPEVSLGPFTDRLRKIGLMDYVGESLFCRTLSADGHLTLNAPELQPALPGSVIVLDTAIRFLTGDENSSQDVRAFADSIFALLRGGAESVIMLHHSPKDMGDRMTLESAMRGSGDLGAFLCSCWGTRLQDPEHPYESRSYLENLKQRDFESKSIEVTCGADCRMHIIGDPASQTPKLKTRRGNPGNKDGKDAAAEAFIRANLGLSVRDLEEQLAALEIDRRKTWIGKVQARIKAEMGKSGVKVSEAA
jgi:Bifunctional DNA primase/polymerase, N-terminal/AAA domain